MKNNHSSSIFGQQGLKGLFLSLFFICSSAAVAQDQIQNSDAVQDKWVPVTLDTSPIHFFYEKSSIGVSPENTNWRVLNVLFQFVDDSQKENVDDNVRNNSEIYALTIDCIHESARLDQHVYYDERWGQGEVAGTDTLTADFKPATAAIDRYFLDLVCQDIPKPSLIQP